MVPKKKEELIVTTETTVSTKICLRGKGKINPA